MFYRFWKFVFILMVSGLIGISCSSSSDDDDGGTPAGTIDNSDFYGTYEATRQIGSCAEETFLATVGNDKTRSDEDGYLYIPESQNLEEYTFNNDYYKISVSGNTVTIEKDGGDWTVDFVVEFSDDYNSFTIVSGTLVDDDADCTGTITGSATRVTTTTRPRPTTSRMLALPPQPQPPPSRCRMATCISTPPPSFSPTRWCCSVSGMRSPTTRPPM